MDNKKVSVVDLGALMTSCGFNHLPDCLGENPAYLELQAAGLSVLATCPGQPKLYHVVFPPDENWKINRIEEGDGWDVLDPQGISRARIVNDPSVPGLLHLEQS